MDDKYYAQNPLAGVPSPKSPLYFHYKGRIFAPLGISYAETANSRLASRKLIIRGHTAALSIH